VIFQYFRPIKTPFFKDNKDFTACFLLPPKQPHNKINAMQKQNRRQFLKNAAAGAGFAITCGFLSGCCPKYKQKKDKPANAREDYDKLAYCCLDCSACELFIATRDNNEQLKAEVAKKWQMDKTENFKLEDFNCFGCKSEKHCYFDPYCTVKKCAIEKRFPTCAYCDDLDACDKPLWKDHPQIMEKAKDIRTKLRS
jgi:hypothetical protein